MKTYCFRIIVMCILLLSPITVAASEVSVLWAHYDGLTAEYVQELEAAFEQANPDIDVKITLIVWNQMYDYLMGSLGSKDAPDISIIGTRWLLELLEMGLLEPIENHLSKALLDNIPESIMEGKIKNVLYGLPVAVGPRLMYYRSDLIEKAPETFEEMLEVAKKIHNPPNIYGLGMAGTKYSELADFVYYLYGNGGDFFEIKPDGSYGQCVVNSEAGVKALTFMNAIVNTHKIVPDTVLENDRIRTQEIFLNGKLGIFLSGGFTASLLEQRQVPFAWKPAVMPHFDGKPRATLFVTDSIVMFKSAQDKAAAAKFLEFFYQDEWRLKFDQLVGFPPVTKSLGDHPYFQKPVYQIMVQSMEGAKGWPLFAEWPTCTNILWDAVVSVFQGKQDPQSALDQAAIAISEFLAASRGM